MATIDHAWIKARLTGERGEKTALAVAAGLTPKQLSYILAGQRKVQQDEAARIADFFKTQYRSGFADPQSAFAHQDDVEPLRENAPTALTDAASQSARTPMIYRATSALPDLLIDTGDILTIDLAHHGQPGDLVICTITNMHTDESVTQLRRRVDPWLIQGTDLVRLDSNEGQAAVLGVVTYVLRNTKSI